MSTVHVLRWCNGWVRVEAEGGFPERLLNRIAQKGIRVWGVRLQEERMRFYCFARDYRALRDCARHACVRMRVKRKRGLPFIINRYRHHKGLLVGALIYVAVLLLLSPRIWAIDVVGCSDEIAQQVLEQTADMGVTVGARMADIDIKGIEITGLSRLPMLSWITVNPSGSVARVEVTVREETPSILDLSEPSDMVAVRDGRVVSMRVVSGQSCVLIGEGVSVGSTLISGRVESEELGVRLYRSYGEIWAETARQITVTVPLNYERGTAAAPVVLRPTVTFLGWQIPLYADVPLGDHYRLSEREHFLTSDGLRLPLGISNAYYVPIEYVRATRTQEEAQRLADKQLREQEQELFANIQFTETSREETISAQEYRLTVQYACVENIAVEVPLQPDE